jgi:cell fate regulator YaaT (PSP1 superfamily)
MKTDETTPPAETQENLHDEAIPEIWTACVQMKTRTQTFLANLGTEPVRKGDKLVVETENGPTIGTVAMAWVFDPSDPVPGRMKTVLRRVTEEDLRIERENGEIETRAYRFCLSCIGKRNLPMKLIEVEYLFDRSKLIFYFTAESRVDFRELVKDLVQEFKTRIELRQIWVRSEAQLLGGIGICGREVCCIRFLNTFAPVSIKMAKEQQMLLNPEKISGLCGRLMCCLAYEYGHYAKAKKRLPKCGAAVETDLGKGTVVRQNLLEGKVTVSLEDGKEVEVTLLQLRSESSISL